MYERLHTARGLSLLQLRGLHSISRRATRARTKPRASMGSIEIRVRMMDKAESKRDCYTRSEHDVATRVNCNFTPVLIFLDAQVIVLENTGCAPKSAHSCVGSIKILVRVITQTIIASRFALIIIILRQTLFSAMRR